MDMIELGRALLERRKKLHFSQEYLARLNGMSRATISQFENGKLPELGLRKVIGLFSSVGLSLELRPELSRPTLRELMKENDYA